MFFVHLFDQFVKICKILLIMVKTIPMYFIAIFVSDLLVVFIYFFQRLKLLSILLLWPTISLEINTFQLFCWHFLLKISFLCFLLRKVNFLLIKCVLLLLLNLILMLLLNESLRLSLKFFVCVNDLLKTNIFQI